MAKPLLRTKPGNCVARGTFRILFRRCACKDPAYQGDFLHHMAQARVRFAQDVVNQPVWLFRIQSG